MKQKRKLFKCVCKTEMNMETDKERKKCLHCGKMVVAENVKV